MRPVIAAAILSVSLAGPACAAQEFYIGEPVVKEGMQIVPNYLTGIRMDKMPTGMGMGDDAVHLEADIHATSDETHGFAEDAWIPYLSVSFVLTKEGAAAYKKNGLLYPMIAKDGPHYATNVDMAGAGTYHLTYIISPPPSHGFLRHVDKASGVPDWWKPVTVSWTFTYPSKSK